MRKPFCEEVQSPNSSKYHFIPEGITKSGSANKTAKLQQIHKTDELDLTVQHMPDSDEIFYTFYVIRGKAQQLLKGFYMYW